MDLTGKTALVTGASSGIGAATAVVLADLGADVAIGYFNNEKGASDILRAVEERGRKAVVIHADVRESSGCRYTVARAEEELGPLDILVNNAGSLVERLRILELTEERWD